MTTEFTYVSDQGISVEGHNHTSQIATSLVFNSEAKSKLLNDTIWVDEKMLNATSWQSNDAIVFSMLTDGSLGIYEHKETCCQIALCEKYYDLTDDAWLCVRPSGTEPKVKFYYGVKGVSLEDADKKSAAFGKEVLAMIDKML